MKLKYIGTDDPGDNAEVTVFGLTFTRGEAVDVEDADIAKKLAGNPTFEVVTGRRSAPSE
jgi:predicted amidohydrolase